MTVKCLSKTVQKSIVRHFTAGRANQTELADIYLVHRRTIQRVLLNHGIIHYRTRPDLRQGAANG